MGDDDRVRLFIALTPPAPVADELAAATAELRDRTPELRWAPPGQWHLTLAFLGEVDDGRAAELGKRLARVARRHPPLRLAFASGGRFGSRVLWTRVEGDREPLRRLAGSVQAAARRCGVALEERAYRPHLTLARARGGRADLASLVERLRGFSGRAWTADELHLVRSQLGGGPGGTALHENVASWPLTGDRGAGPTSVTFVG
jgi:2'-5' RNA ligase